LTYRQSRILVTIHIFILLVTGLGRTAAYGGDCLTVAYKWKEGDDGNKAAKFYDFSRFVALLAILFVASALTLIFLPAVISYPITISIFTLYSSHLVRQVQRRYSDREGNARGSSFRLGFSRKEDSVIMGYICINCGAYHKLKTCPICHSKIKKPWFK
jgi:hypothetical protein